MRKHKAPPGGHPISSNSNSSPSSVTRTMPTVHNDTNAAGTTATATVRATAIATTATSTTAAATALDMEQQRMLLGHAAVDSATPAAAAAATAAAAVAATTAAATSPTSRLATPAATCQQRSATVRVANGKERPRYTVQLMSLLHIASYVLCLCAFSFALYANVRQTRVEQRLQRLQELDARIVELELRLEQQQLLHWPADQPQILSSPISSSSSSNSDSNSNSENGTSSHLVLHVRRELHRLRRDVSHLQLTRRQQRRQAAEAAAAAAAANLGGSPAANGECQCQPGLS
ncbi:hypothetical protein AWZ03_001230 [Drosophila navojoa]|uniref:Uncharacterized protein n=1 Tax=Drosophila navojoa TaxID=7232 RepID=A0A484BWD4_DRONA|nr:hypothetical protein AWZ03_001230 [Drosophila navojoa]